MQVSLMRPCIHEVDAVGIHRTATAVVSGSYLIIIKTAPLLQKAAISPPQYHNSHGMTTIANAGRLPMVS